MQIEELQNKHKGKSCFVVGNGPSVNDINFTKLIDKNVIVTNCFHMHPLWPQLKNVYHIELNGAFRNDIETFRWKIYNLLRNKHSKYILRYKFKPYWEISAIPDERKSYLRLINNPNIFNGKYNWDIETGSLWANSGVIEGSMALAQYMGFKTIYLIGCDATPYYDGTGDASSAYFYDWKQTPKVYWPRKEDNYDYKNMLKAWEIIYKLFKSKGIEIYNLSKRSNIKCIKKIDFDNLEEY